MGAKICRAIERATPITLEDGSDGKMVEFLPETPELIGKITLIHPDEDGVQWYWTPDVQQEP